MLKITYASHFQRDIKAIQKKHWDVEPLKEVIRLVTNQQWDTLQRKHRDHLLKGSFGGHRECHIDLTKDWIMRYLVEGDKAVFERTGTHKEVLGKR
jgi:mRNA interferase YafQ